MVCFTCAGQNLVTEALKRSCVVIARFYSQNDGKCAGVLYPDRVSERADAAAVSLDANHAAERYSIRTAAAARITDRCFLRNVRAGCIGRNIWPVFVDIIPTVAVLHADLAADRSALVCFATHD